MNDLNSKDLLNLYETGQDEAATEIFDRYAERLIALARSRIGAKLRRRVDPEDVVQSAFRSFFVHAKDAQYQLSETGDLWRLLARITLNKLYRQAERQTADKRTIQREDSTALAASAMRAPEPSPAEVVAFVEEVKLALRNLPHDERRSLGLSLEGHNVDEIAQLMGKSLRTARRLLASAREKIEKRLFAEEPNRPTSFLPVADAEAPLRYTDYVLEKLLGSGGMGKIFRARDKTTGNIVAFKSLHKSRQRDERAVAQFVQEAQVLEKLQHPNIVGYHGLGRFPSGGLFLVMEFVDGVDLQSQLRQGAMPIGDTLEIMKQVANAVQHAHDHGVVHCDLKPENVLLDRANRAVVTDFGFAYLMTGGSSQRIGGTAGFIAPEVLNRQAEPMPTADVYALGILIQTLITRRPPSELRRDSLKEIEPASIRDIIQRCVDDDPKQRYQTIGELLQALSAIVIAILNRR